MVECDQLGDRSARGDADQVRGPKLVGVEHADGVGDEVAAAVSGAAGRVAG